MSAIHKLEKALDVIGRNNVSVKLYLITRHIKEGVKVNAKMIDKYSFIAKTVDLSEELNKFFVEVASMQLKKIITKNDYCVEEYAVISDDLGDKLYTYSLNNALSFSEVINNQMLIGECQNISSLKEVKKDLWAYSIRFNFGDQSLFTFRKSSKGKIVTDEPRNFYEKILANFDSTDAALKMTMMETISFDDKMDCLFVDGEFLILRKEGFEQIVGLEEEFMSAASEVIDVIKSTQLVDGVNLLESAIKEKRSLLKTLSNIGKKGTHTSFNSEEILKMKQVLNSFEGKELKQSEDGKIVLENEDDLICFVKLLNDYYKQGVVSGKYYGTNGGRVVSRIDNN